MQFSRVQAAEAKHVRKQYGERNQVCFTTAGRGYFLGEKMVKIELDVCLRSCQEQ